MTVAVIETAIVVDIVVRVIRGDSGCGRNDYESDDMLFKTFVAWKQIIMKMNDL